MTYTQLQVGEDVDKWRKALKEVDKQNERGAQIFPQVTSRGVGFMTSLRTYHMFMRRETYIKMTDLSHEARLRELKKADVRAKILADKDIRHPSEGSMENVYEYFGANLHQMFQLRHNILQSATGYVATFVKGVQTRENGVDLGRRPGRVDARRSLEF